jgi:hypothetical protein
MNDNTTRPDDPIAVSAHRGRFYGGRALVILGGPSAGSGAWEELRDKLKPDVLLTCNGATNIPGVDYWLLGENMSRAAGYAEHGIERDRKFMRMFTDPNTAKTKMISHRSWHLLDRFGIDKSNCICIRRRGYELEEIPADFSLREYGEGFFYGGLFKRRAAVGRRVQYHVGTVALHLIHLAGILGCAEVHTIGYDMCFPNGRNGKHHHYDHPGYEPDKFRTEQMFTSYEGLDTMWDWIEAGCFISQIEYLFGHARLRWQDHSHGLLAKMKVWCSNATG